MEHTDRNRASADLFPFADAEDTYWRNEFRTRPYVRSGSSYDEYRDAYRYGWESRAANKTAKAWDSISTRLGKRMGEGQALVAAGVERGQGSRPGRLASRREGDAG